MGSIAAHQVRRFAVGAALLLVLPLLVFRATSVASATPKVTHWGITGLAISPDGTVYATDCAGARVYRVSRHGRITVIAGAGPGGFVNGFSGDGGPALDAHFACPYRIAFDAAGNLYVADHLNDRIRKIDTNGIVTTVVGDGIRGFGGTPSEVGDGGPATAAHLSAPVGITFDDAGNMFIADRDHDDIRQVGTDGIITTVAGTGIRGYNGDGQPAVDAKINRPLGVAVDPDGNLVIADENNERIRRVDGNGMITTIAGTGRLGCSPGGPATSVPVQNATSIAYGPNGGLYIAEGECNQVTELTPKGNVKVIAGTGKDGCGGSDGAVARKIRLSGPTAIAVDEHGNVYVDSCGKLLQVDPGGRVHVYAQAKPA